MSVPRISILWAAIIAIGSLASPALARPMPPSLMESGEVIPAPRGYLAMCEHQSTLCDRPADVPGEHATLTDKQRMTLIRAVNRQVNGAVRYRADRDEQWQRAISDGNGVGDCEDFAIQKHAMLVAAGFPAQDLFYAIGYLPRAGLHTVLIARTDKGDMVLDSLTPWISMWERTSYIWLARQSSADPMVWTRTESSLKLPANA